MADKLKDAEDRLLESMFQSEPIDDAGFSQRIVSRIRRRLWIQRLALPVAMLIGGAIAIKPAMQLMTVASKLLTVVPQDLLELPVSMLPQNLLELPVSMLPQVESVAFGASLLQTAVLGAMLVVAGVLGTRMLNE